DHVVYASQKGDITEEEAEVLIQYNALRFDSLLTDVFDKHLLKAQVRRNPHSLDNAVHQLTDYAQLKNDAQTRNGIIPDGEVVSDNLAVSDNDSVDKKTGDANPNHGYESDGDVEMVSEQNTVEEVRTQTDFGDTNPDAEALDHRHRDAASHLNERMSNNHSMLKHSIDDIEPVEQTDTPEKSDMVKNRVEEPAITDTANTTSTTDDIDSKWQDGLRRDENDKT
ncbi:MAG: hypothetical protein ABS921_09115, partial [Psychrobacter alimentarius]